jgi:cell division protein FtsA
LLEGIIKPRLNEIFTMVRMDLEKANLINRVPSGAVITGGGALTVGAVESAKRVLGLPVRVGEPSGVGGLVDDVLTPNFATAVGLILYAVNQDMTPDSQGIGKKIPMPSGKSVSGPINKVIDFVKSLLP